MIALAACSGYRLLKDLDRDWAQQSLSRGSEDLLAGMERPGGPFDGAYSQARQGEARAALDTGTKAGTQGGTTA